MIKRENNGDLFLIKFYLIKYIKQNNFYLKKIKSLLTFNKNLTKDRFFPPSYASLLDRIALVYCSVITTLSWHFLWQGLLIFRIIHFGYIYSECFLLVGRVGGLEKNGSELHNLTDQKGKCYAIAPEEIPWIWIIEGEGFWVLQKISISVIELETWKGP